MGLRLIILLRYDVILVCQKKVIKIAIPEAAMRLFCQNM